jgi:hypothetical protein
MRTSSNTSQVVAVSDIPPVFANPDLTKFHEIYGFPMDPRDRGSVRIALADGH